MMSFADSLRAILCQKLLLDDEKGKRFPVHELLLRYDSVSALIRRGEFKKLDQELEVGQSRGMLSFEASQQMRVEQGWVPTTQVRQTGFSQHEVAEYLGREAILSN